MFGMFGATKRGEYSRSAEYLQELVNEQGLYYALAFIVDIGYDSRDLKEILRYMKPKTRGVLLSWE
jgi:hypothetical protein